MLGRLAGSAVPELAQERAKPESLASFAAVLERYRLLSQLLPWRNCIFPLLFLGTQI